METWTIGSTLTPSYNDFYWNVFDIAFDIENDVLVLANWSNDGILGEYIFTYDINSDQWSSITTCDSGGEGIGINLAYDHHKKKVVLGKYYQTYLRLFEIDVSNETCNSEVELYQPFGNVSASDDALIYDSKRQRYIYTYRTNDETISVGSITDGIFSLMTSMSLPNGYEEFQSNIPISFLQGEDQLFTCLVF